MIKQAYGDAAMSRSSEAKLHAVALLEIPLHGERDDTSKQLFTGNSVLTLHRRTGYCAGRFLFVKAPPTTPNRLNSPPSLCMAHRKSVLLLIDRTIYIVFFQRGISPLKHEIPPI